MTSADGAYMFAVVATLAADAADAATLALRPAGTPAPAPLGALRRTLDQRGFGRSLDA